MIDKGIGAHDVNAVIHYGMVLCRHGRDRHLVYACLPKDGGTDLAGHGHRHSRRALRAHQQAELCRTRSLWHAVAHHAHHQRRNQVQLAVALGVRMLIRWPFLAVGSMCAALAIDLKLGVIFLICPPAIALVFLVCHGALHSVLQAAAGKARPHRAYLPRGPFAPAWFAPLYAKVMSASALPKRPMTRPIPPSRWASSRQSLIPSRFW